jgi:hypothetical protein
MTEKALYSLPPRNVKALVDELALLSVRSSQGEKIELPLITLHLKSGRDFAGWLLARGGEKREELGAVLLRLFQPGTSPAVPDLLYVDLTNIEAVTVQNPISKLPRLSEKWIEPPPNFKPVSRHAIKQDLNTLAQSIEQKFGMYLILEVSWETMPDTAEARFWLQEAVYEVGTTLSAIMADELARQSIVPVLQIVKFRSGEPPSLQLQEKTLLVTIDFALGKNGCLKGDELRRAIEDLF